MPADELSTFGVIASAFLALIGVNYKVSQGQVQKAVDSKVDAKLSGLLSDEEHEKICGLRLQIVTGSIGGLKEDFRDFRREYKADIEALHRRLDEFANR